MFDHTQMKQLIQAAEQAWYACPHQTCLVRGCPNGQSIAHETKEMFSVFVRMFDGLQILSNTTKHDQARSNTIKQHQTRCPNDKMFGHQTFIVCPGPNKLVDAFGQYPSTVLNSSKLICNGRPRPSNDENLSLVRMESAARRRSYFLFH